MVVVLSAVEESKARSSLTYNYISRVLSEDYIYLYYINLDNGDYIVKTVNKGETVI